MTNIQYYKAPITTTKPSGLVDLKSLLNRIASPRNDNIYDKIQQAEQLGDNITKSKLKTQLYFITPCVVTDGLGRAYKNIKEFTGLLALDFDHIEQPEQFRDDLFNEYSFVIASWLSASRQGVKALVSIPICSNVDEFKSYFWGLALEEMQQFVGFDKAPQNPALPMFLSYDRDIKIRDDFTTWQTKGDNPKLYNHIEPLKIDLVQPADKAIQTTLRNIETVGHPVWLSIRGYAYFLGGLVGAGRADYSDVKNSILAAMNANPNVTKQYSRYVRVALDSFDSGITKPIYQ